MFKALAEAWYWHPEAVERLTPAQVIHLSGGKPGGAGGKIDITSQADLDYWRERWMNANSEEAILKKAERILARTRPRA